MFFGDLFHYANCSVTWNGRSLGTHSGYRMWNVPGWETSKGTGPAIPLLWLCRMADSLPGSLMVGRRANSKEERCGYNTTDLIFCFMVMTAKLLIVYMLPEWSQRDLHREKRALCSLTGRKIQVQQTERTRTHLPSRLLAELAQNPVSNPTALLNCATFFGEEENNRHIQIYLD